jgi:hypothetical protein
MLVIGGVVKHSWPDPNGDATKSGRFSPDFQERGTGRLTAVAITSTGQTSIETG